VGRVAFSPDSRRLAVATSHDITIYNVANRAEECTLSGHRQHVEALAFSADGSRLVSGGADRAIKLWDLATQKELFSTPVAHIGSIRSVGFNHTEDRIFFCGHISAAGNVRGAVHFLSPRGQRMPLSISFPFAINAAAYTPDGGYIACGGDDGIIHFMDARTGQTAYSLRGHADAVQRIAFTSDGNRLVSGASDGTVRVGPVRNPEFDTMPLPSSGVSALACAGDGSQLAATNSIPRPAPLPARVVLHWMGEPPAQRAIEVDRSKGVLALALSPDKRWIAAGELGGLRCWDLETGAARLYLDEPDVAGISISPDGRFLATARRSPDVDIRPDILRKLKLLGTRAAREADGLLLTALQGRPKQPAAIKIWRAEDGQLERVLPGQIAVAFSPDSHVLAGADDRSVRLRDVASGKELQTLTGPSDPILKVQFVGGGRRVIGFTHRQAYLWDVDTGRTLATLNGLQGPAFVTPDGLRVVSLDDGILKWWDLRLGRELLLLSVPDLSLQQLTLSADGHHIVAAGRSRLVVWRAPP
jgi:WD40 repeat protein